MQSNLRHSHFIEEFLSQFEPKKHNSVIESLIILGIDLANKTGIRNPQELQRLLKQLSRNIQEQTQGDIRSEIKTIQKQLRDLNDFIQVSHRDAWSNQGTHQKQKQPQYKIKQNQFRDSREQNNIEYQNTFPTQKSQSKSPNHYQDRTPHKLKQSRSHSQRNLTPKITESPPPPQIVYINKMNNKFDIKPQFDDRQIKKLLYGDNKPSDRGRYFNQKNPSPQQLFYSSQTSGGTSYRQQPAHQEFYHNVDKKKPNTSPKKLPAYLQGVESKIKFLLDEAKQQYKDQQKDREKNSQNINIRESNQSNQLQQQNSAETDTFFDIQQYIQDQKKYQFSPVQEMNDDERNENQNEDLRNENQNEDVSDTYSNFTPPDDEVKEFFQQQYLMQQRKKQ